MEDLNRHAINGFNKFAIEYGQIFSVEGAFFDAIEFLSSELKDQASILELGCGPGNFLNHLVKRRPNIQIEGIDLAHNMIEIAKSKLPNATFQICDVRNYEFDKKFDAIILSFCTPYLNKDEVANLIRNCSSNLNSNGIIYLSTMEGDYNLSEWVSSSKDKNTRSFTYYYSRKELKSLLEKNALSIIYEEQIEIPNNRTMASNDLVLICQRNKI